jgi:hypothetical protein
VSLIAGSGRFAIMRKPRTASTLVDSGRASEQLAGHCHLQNLSQFAFDGWV